jgi:hypothetical protein
MYPTKLSIIIEGEIKTFHEPVLVAHAYNPSYSGVRDQKDLGSKPDQANRA